jgi:hypothetical protein
MVELPVLAPALRLKPLQPVQLEWAMDEITV